MYLLCLGTPKPFLLFLSNQTSVRDWGGRGIRSDYLVSTEFSSGVLRMSWNYIVMMVTQHCECTDCHWIVHLKMVNVNFMLCECHLNEKYIIFHTHCWEPCVVVSLRLLQGGKVLSVLKTLQCLLPKLQGGEFIFVYWGLLCARPYARHLIGTAPLTLSILTRLIFLHSVYYQLTFHWMHLFIHFVFSLKISFVGAEILSN